MNDEEHTCPSWQRGELWRELLTKSVSVQFERERSAFMAVNCELWQVVTFNVNEAVTMQLVHCVARFWMSFAFGRVHFRLGFSLQQRRLVFGEKWGTLVFILGRLRSQREVTNGGVSECVTSSSPQEMVTPKSSIRSYSTLWEVCWCANIGVTLPNRKLEPTTSILRLNPLLRCSPSTGLARSSSWKVLRSTPRLRSTFELRSFPFKLGSCVSAGYVYIKSNWTAFFIHFSTSFSKSCRKTSQTRLLP